MVIGGQYSSLSGSSCAPKYGILNNFWSQVFVHFFTINRTFTSLLICTLTTSKDFTGIAKFGFFFAFCMMEEDRTLPAHSMSMRGLSTVVNCTRFKSRTPQNKICSKVNEYTILHSQQLNLLKENILVNSSGFLYQPQYYYDYFSRYWQK